MLKKKRRRRKENEALPTITKVNAKDFVFPVSDVCGDEESSRKEPQLQAFRDERESREELDLGMRCLKLAFSLHRSRFKPLTLFQGQGHS